LFSQHFTGNRTSLVRGRGTTIWIVVHCKHLQSRIRDEQNPTSNEAEQSLRTLHDEITAVIEELVE